MYSITYDIFCDKCSNWEGNGCNSKREAEKWAKLRDWKIVAGTKPVHLCPRCKEKPCAD